MCHSRHWHVAYKQCFQRAIIRLKGLCKSAYLRHSLVMVCMTMLSLHMNLQHGMLDFHFLRFILLEQAIAGYVPGSQGIREKKKKEVVACIFQRANQVGRKVSSARKDRVDNAEYEPNNWIECQMTRTPAGLQATREVPVNHRVT